LFAGIDGGQTSTQAVIGDESGALRGRASGPPADLVGERRDSTRTRDVLTNVLRDALLDAGAGAAQPLAAAVAGISGYDEGEALPFELPGVQRVRLVHDSAIALAGALGGKDGIVTIAGTGSVAFGTDAAGGSARAGGWGYLLGDEGSAFTIARRALAHAMLEYDRGVASELERRALAHFAVPSLRALQHALAHGEIERPALAGFAPAVLQAAEAGDSGARSVRAEAVIALAELVRIVDSRLAPAPLRRVSHAGGLFADAWLLDHWRRQVALFVPHATVVHAQYEPVAGALLLAYRDAGVDIGELRGVAA
jgi:N-acetylglucosamine kinase-like BadF-type ATPase